MEQSTTRSAAPSRAATGAIAGGAAAAGMAGGFLASRLLRPHRSGTAELARQIAVASVNVGRLSNDVQTMRAEAGEHRRQSPIEVLLSGLTSRRLPRRG